MSSALLMLAGVEAAMANPVLLISIDGMKPEYVLEAQSKGLKLPYLSSLMANGVYADGVTGVWPTVTYPSHTTLLTGVSPAEHGILANLEFDPLHHFDAGWFWYAGQIRVPTLWDAAHAAGIATASVGWPVSVGATAVDYLIPEYWRITGATEDLNPTDRHLMDALSRPTGLLEQLQDSAGRYMMGNDTTLNGDEIKARFTIEIIRTHKPGFMTLHLSSLDEAEHEYGVFSQQAGQDLEALDTLLVRIAAAAHASDPATVVAVVSDHGFMPIAHLVNLYIPFIKAGLVQVKQDPRSGVQRIAAWASQPWLSSGMAAIMLKDPGDQHTEQVTGELLTRLAADPDSGIAAVLSRGEIKKSGGFPDAAFIVTLKPGYYTGDSLTGDLVTAIPGSHGGHGFSPELAQMRAAFFIAGDGVAHHRDLGLIDMRQIAPTIAQILGVPLPTAKSAALPISP